MENKCVKVLIEEALEEAHIMELAREAYDNDHMLYIAQRLSGAPYSFVEQVYTMRA